MNKKSLLLFIFIISNFFCFAQVTFEKAHYITNNNQKIVCYIKNMDWKNNPKEFYFKINDNDEPTVLKIEAVKEFEILNKSKYIRYDINIDKSSNSLDNLNYNTRNPVFKKETVFLKEIVKGKANLYYFSENNNEIFFFSLNDDIPEQLVFKKYKSKDGQIAESMMYKNQLWNSFKKDNIKLTEIEKINYYYDDLLNFFLQYNKDLNSNSTTFENSKPKFEINKTIRVGLMNGKMDLVRNYSSNLMDFDMSQGYRVGCLLEYVFPFNNSKWSVFFEPAFQQISFNKDFDFQKDAKFTYTSLDISFGTRHYMYLNSKNKFFINAQLNLSLRGDVKGSYFVNNATTSIGEGTKSYVNIGVGYVYGKYNIELRMHPKRNLVNASFNANYSGFDLLFGYTF